jgi:serine/threonine-protein kinase NIM1
VHVLQKLHHEHIVRVMDVIEVVDATYIIMERVDGPELTDFIRMHESGRLPSSVARPLLVQIVLALRHAHQNGFLHCDVKPDNIRMNRECDCAILTDWGFAREPGCRPENYMCGTPQYASPEQLTGYCPDSLTGRRALSTSTDVWSVGVTFFEMVNGYLPFIADDFHGLMRLVLATKYKVAEYVDTQDAALIEAMLHVAPCDRVPIDELLAHPAILATGGEIEEHSAKCGGSDGRQKPEPSTWWRKCAWMMLYALICVAALWSHVQAPNGETLPESGTMQQESLPGVGHG